MHDAIVAMRQLRFRTLSRLLAGPFLGLVLASVISTTANAAITITSINDTRASNIEGVGTANITVYGGVTGSLSRCASSPTDATCDNCVTSTTGDNGLIACNNRRIHPDLRFQITIKSDSVETGVPRITTNADSSTTQATLVDTPTTVAKNTDVTITVTWSSLCNLIASANSGTSPFSSSGTCTLAANTDEARAILRVGIDDGSGDGDVDDFKTITFIVRDGIEVDGSGVSLGKSCGGDASNDDITAVGICYFEVGSGDKKAFMKKIAALNNFPTGTNIRFNWVRALYTKRTSPNTPNHAAINASSTFEDLLVSGSDPSSLSLSPARITNSIENDAVYDFKVAVVDAARNVGYYTAAAHDTDCDSADSTSPTPPTGSGAAECHTARPSEVVGILSEQTNCFVATATYGSPMAKEVSTFRAFRDRFIVPTSWGKAFVRFYYKEGPKAASFIAENETLRTASRVALWAPLQMAKFALQYGGAAALALLFTIIAAPIAISRTISRMSARNMKRATHV